MAATRTQGITVDTDDNFTINKEYRGTRLFFRLGKISQDQAEHTRRSTASTASWSGKRMRVQGLRTARHDTSTSPEISVHLTSLPYTSGC